MKNIIDFIFESMSFDDKIQKWWDNTKVTPVYVIKKSNKPIAGKIEIVGKPVIYKVKQVTGNKYDDLVHVGSNRYEMKIDLKDEQLLSKFEDTKWTPVSVFTSWDYNHGEQKVLKSWDEIRKYVNDRDFEGQIEIYKGPQPKE